MSATNRSINPYFSAGGFGLGLFDACPQAQACGDTAVHAGRRWINLEGGNRGDQRCGDENAMGFVGRASGGA